ncbi:MAG: hypothetical protein JST35_07580 [Armatimonadetes bacterium]|nr:hypothetical protein [Armatimonadota bacterium]
MNTSLQLLSELIEEFQGCNIHEPPEVKGRSTAWGVEERCLIEDAIGGDWRYLVMPGTTYQIDAFFCMRPSFARMALPAYLCTMIIELAPVRDWVPLVEHLWGGRDKIPPNYTYEMSDIQGDFDQDAEWIEFIYRLVPDVKLLFCPGPTRTNYFSFGLAEGMTLRPEDELRVARRIERIRRILLASIDLHFAHVDEGKIPFEAERIERLTRLRRLINEEGCE